MPSNVQQTSVWSHMPAKYAQPVRKKQQVMMPRETTLSVMPYIVPKIVTLS